MKIVVIAVLLAMPAALNAQEIDAGLLDAVSISDLALQNEDLQVARESALGAFGDIANHKPVKPPVPGHIPEPPGGHHVNPPAPPHGGWHTQPPHTNPPHTNPPPVIYPIPTYPDHHGGHNGHYHNDPIIVHPYPVEEVHYVGTVDSGTMAIIIGVVLLVLLAVLLL